MRKPIAIHEAIIARCADDAHHGNATHMRSFVTAFRDEFTPATVRYAVHGLADGRVAPVNGMALRHVGRGFYELLDTRAQRETEIQYLELDHLSFELCAEKADVYAQRAAQATTAYEKSAHRSESRRYAASAEALLDEISERSV